MRRIIVLGVVGFVMFLNFTGAFAIGPWLKIPFVFLLLSIGGFLSICLVRPSRIVVRPVNIEGILLAGALGTVVIAGAFNPNDRTLNYVFAYLFVFIACYFILRAIIHNFWSNNSFVYLLTWSVFFVSLFVCTDFIAWNWFNLDLQAELVRTKPATATYHGLRRSYGFTTEPTILALYFNTIGVLGLWYVLYLQQNRSVRLIYGLIFLFAWATTFSGAGLPILFFSFIVSAFIIELITSIRKGVMRARLGTLVCGVLVLVIVGMHWDATTLFAPGERIIKKVTLDPSVAGVRLHAWTEGLKAVAERPLLGAGPGWSSSNDQSSSLNWYIFVAKESGLLASVLFLLFWLVVYIRVVGSTLNGRLILAAGVLAGGLHFFAISTFWHPFYWVMLASVSEMLFSSKDWMRRKENGLTRA